ncbi:MAG TPA: hypothetical protein VMZ00_16195 [Sporichthya sp.]|nr:hypothetical protein [Sporichthya sp.]
MNNRLTNLGVKTLTGALIGGGLLFVLLGFLGVRRSSSIVLQMPYVASGGIGGLAMIALGALLVVQNQIREQARRAAAVTEALEEWKDAALSEFRAFLEGASLEMELRDPEPVRNGFADPRVLEATVG